MKKIFTLSSLAVLLAVVIASCTRSSRGDYGYDEDYYLSKERGVVVFSDSYCPYYVVETEFGYTVIESVSGYTPYEGSIIYGDLSGIGLRDLYNYSSRTVTRGDVIDYWLSYYDAQYLIDNMCYADYKGQKKQITKTNGVGHPGTPKNK
jgi:hypothetical protein